MFRRIVSAPTASSSCLAIAASSSAAAGLSSSSALVGSSIPTTSSINQQFRAIRTQIPPRPLATVVTFLDKSGNPIRNRVETELALIKTRDNKFWLQRILSDGSYIRWRVPGLDKMKNASSFETFSMHDIDEGGGVQIPHEVAPWAPTTPPEYNDAILAINKMKPVGKVTRKDRRYWNREVFATINTHVDKHNMHWRIRLVFVCSMVALLYQRLAAAWRNDKSFFDGDVYTPRIQKKEGEYASTFDRMMAFGDNHPEHSFVDHKQYMSSPGQVKLAFARHDLHGEDVHTPDMDGSMFAWQMNHFANYHHWPKPLDAQ